MQRFVDSEGPEGFVEASLRLSLSGPRRTQHPFPLIDVERVVFRVYLAVCRGVFDLEARRWRVRWIRGLSGTG